MLHNNRPAIVIKIQLPVLLRAVANGMKNRDILGLTPCFVSHVLSTSGIATALKEQNQSKNWHHCSMVAFSEEINT